MRRSRDAVDGSSKDPPIIRMDSPMTRLAPAKHFKTTPVSVSTILCVPLALVSPTILCVPLALVSPTILCVPLALVSP